MRRWLLATGATLTAAASAATAQPGTQHGYLIIRVVLDNGGGGAAAGQPPSGTPPGYSSGPPGEGGSEGAPPGGGGYPGSGGGFPGPGGFPGGGTPGAAPPAEAARSVVAVIPYTNIQRNQKFNPNAGFNPTTNPTGDLVRTKYGQTYLFIDKTNIQLTELIPGTYEKAVRDKHEKWNGRRSDLEMGFELVTEALLVGLAEEAAQYAKELAAQVTIAKDKTPSARVAAFKTAYDTVAAKLDAPLPEAADVVEEWKTKIGAAAAVSGPHYTLMYFNQGQTNPDDVNRRLRLLERNLKAFYLWHALQGVALPPPAQRLLAVMADRPSDMPRLRDALDGLPMNSDAFYSPQHDLLVLSPERLDDNGKTFVNLVQASYKEGWDRERMATGKGLTVPAGKTADDVKRISTLAVVDKVLEEEADHAAVSREGSRQLYVASGLLPRNVHLPEWLESGAAAFFQKPKGPVFTRPGGGQPGQEAGKWTMTVGLVAGYGGPNFAMHRLYKDLLAKKALHPDPALVLRNVLTDRYFEAVRTGTDADPVPDKPEPGTSNPGAAGGPPGGGAPGRGLGGGAGRVGPPPGAPPAGGAEGPPGGGEANEDPAVAKRKNREKLDAKAHATAWALTYYLNKTRMPGLQKFYAEVRRMPRDMQLGDKAVLMTFARCFNLLTADGTAVDEAAFKQFAGDWEQFMKNVSLSGRDFVLDGSQANPGGGGVPGGGIPGGFGPGNPGGAPGGGAGGQSGRD